MTHQEHADNVRECLEAVEAANRALHKAVKKLHKALAAYAVEYGGEVGIGEVNVALAAAPKNPPDNE